MKRRNTRRTELYAQRDKLFAQMSGEARLAYQKAAVAAAHDHALSSAAAAQAEAAEMAARQAVAHEKAVIAAKAAAETAAANQRGDLVIAAAQQACVSVHHSHS